MSLAKIKSKKIKTTARKTVTRKPSSKKPPTKKSPYEVLTWAQYLDKLQLGHVAEVERELRKDLDADELDGYRKAQYIVVDKLYEPDLNQDCVLPMCRKKRAPLPPGFEEVSDEYFTKDGNLVFAIVAIKGDGMSPRSVF